jgi:hypothetical protein
LKSPPTIAGNPNPAIQSLNSTIESSRPFVTAADARLQVRAEHVQRGAVDVDFGMHRRAGRMPGVGAGQQRRMRRHDREACEDDHRFVVEPGTRRGVAVPAVPGAVTLSDSVPREPRASFEFRRVRAVELLPGFDEHENAGQRLHRCDGAHLAARVPFGLQADGEIPGEHRHADDRHLSSTLSGEALALPGRTLGGRGFSPAR